MLTEKQWKVALLVAKGESNKEAAWQLKIGEKTVKWHLTNIFRQFNVKSRQEMIVHLAARPEVIPEHLKVL